MRGPEEWPSHRSNPADKIRLTGPAAIFSSTWAELTKTLPKNLATRLRGTVLNRRLEDKIRHLCALATAAKDGFERSRAWAAPGWHTHTCRCARKAAPST